MNQILKTAQLAAIAYADASQKLDEAKEALKPFARQQIEITRRVAEECGQRYEYDYKPYFYFDWIELEIENYCYVGSEVPRITCQLWYRGRCGDNDSVEAAFTISEHVMNGEPEKFEAELRDKLENVQAKKARLERERKEKEIARLQAELADLQEKTE